MTIEIELSPETEAWLIAQAASRSMDVPAFVISILEEAKPPSAGEANGAPSSSRPPRPIGKASLARLFAESPFKGLNLGFERDQDFGRDVAL